MMTAMRTAALLTGILVGVLARQAVATPAETGVVHMTRILQDPRRCEQALATLGVIGDKELTPLLAGAASNTAAGAGSRRLVAMSALARLGAQEARGPLLYRFRSDPEPMIQGKALALLLNLDAVEADDIRMGLRMEDFHVQCLAARALVARGKGYMAMTTLRDLIDETKTRLDAQKKPVPVPVGVRAMARLALLATGDATQMPVLRGLIRDRKNSPELRDLLAAQITRDKITVAQPLARELVELAEDSEARLLAWEAVSTASPNDASDLVVAVRSSKSAVFQARLLELLAVRPDARTYLPQLADQPGTVGVLVRFELARIAALDKAAGEAALAAVATEQPIAAAYVLSRAYRDVQDARKDGRPRATAASCYTGALLRCIQLASPDSAALDADHHRAGRAAAMLVDIGTTEAVDALKVQLASGFDQRTRAVAAGLIEARNPAVCDLAKTLLASPYPELAWRGGMVLGSFGNVAARDYLARIVAAPDDYPDEKVVLAAWFLAKMEHLAKPTAEQMGQLLKTAAK